jgi:hypothetical protein
MKEIIDVNVAFDTSFEDIELLRVELEQFVRSPDNSRDFQPDIAIGVGGVGDCDKLTLKSHAPLQISVCSYYGSQARAHQRSGRWWRCSRRTRQPSIQRRCHGCLRC